ncbi:hypothetical protein [Paenibacillus koleovorans]|uniref:hypothetical protein n=1 Tax=Paenibacillus koleovorans TaxID=121608 RepID=UPI000FD93F55|nr:hypothetical protein [Paenibacillus koleovorans]
MGKQWIRWIVVGLVLCGLVGLVVPVPPVQAVVPPATQTLTILGDNGETGEISSHTEFTLDGGQTWKPAYLPGLNPGEHPWGLVDGTNNWLNCAVSWSACEYQTVLYRVRFIMPDSFSNPYSFFEFKADNGLKVDLNNQDVASNNIISGGSEGSLDNDSRFNNKLRPGMNELYMELTDSGGMVGFNYKLIIRVEASTAPTVVTGPILSAPTLSSTPSTPTTGTVSVAVYYPIDAVVKQYSVNMSTWLNYSSPVTMTENGTIWARWKDTAGNVSLIGFHEVTQIDRTAPASPTLTVNPATPTNSPVTVAISYPVDSVLNQYRIGEGALLSYTGPVILTVNDIVHGYATDSAGNVSAPGSIVVSNIDMTAPPTPTLTPNTVNPTTGPVLVTLSGWGDASVREYRVNGGSWLAATESELVTMAENGTLEARGKDAAGNESGVGRFQVDNIITDPDPLRVSVAAIRASGTEMTLQFNYPLDTSVLLNASSFHLKGTSLTVSYARYSSDQVVVLMLNEPVYESTSTMPVQLNVDAGAVQAKNGKAMLRWSGLPVKSQSESVALRNQLLTYGSGEAVRIQHVVDYIRLSGADVTGDGQFDRQDVLLLLLQIYPNTRAPV